MTVPPVPPHGSPPDAAGPTDVPVCYRHPERESHIRCTRCERPVCPDCMVPASVGFQCPECVRQGSRDVRAARTRFGGRLSDDPGYVSRALIGVNIVVHLLQLAVPRVDERFANLALARASSGEVVGVTVGEGYRLLSAAFLHGGLLHLLFNMYALFLFGPPLEQLLGRVRFVALYLSCALAGSAASYAWGDVGVASVGASGAIFGLFGAYLVVARHLGRDTTTLLALLAINGVLGFVVPGIDWRAHAGGLVAGTALGLVLVRAPRSGRALVQAVGVAAVVTVAAGLAVWRTAELTSASPATVVRCAVTAPLQAETYPDCLGLVLR